MFQTSQSSVIVGYGVILGDQKHFEKCNSTNSTVNIVLPYYK